MIQNEQLLSIALFALYLLIAWEIFEHFSAHIDIIDESSKLSEVVNTTDDEKVGSEDILSSDTK
jgi:hypothetical protein